MKKAYESPEFEIVKLSLSADVLGVSEGEVGTSSGFIEKPEDDPDMEL